MQKVKREVSERLREKKRRINIYCWLFLLPAFLFYLIFQLYPILMGLYYSLLNWSGMTKAAGFVGLKNYLEIFTDGIYWKAFWNSFKYAILTVPLTLVASLIIAYVLNNELLKMRTFFRTLYFLPVITTSSIIGIVMVFIWGVDGPISTFLFKTGITSKAGNFLSNGSSAFYALVLVSVWKTLGIYMIYWLAGLQGISRDLYEASYVDGCGRWKTFIYIVLPELATIGAVITLLCFINSLKVFDIVKTMTNGGPFYSTEVVGTWVYNKAFSSTMGMPRLGYASAGANFFGIVVIILVAGANILKGRLQEKGE